MDQKIIIPILLETNHFLVVDKPAGLNVERLPQGFPSVEAWVEQYQLQQGKKKPYTGIVHRLDRPVSGALIVAKKKSALKHLNEQFRERQVEKHYLARVEGKPPQSKGQLTHWIEKDQKGKRAIAWEKPRKNAVKSILFYSTLSTDGATSLLDINPITGKFHQIRVQLASLGCPIVGDEKYGSVIPFKPNAIALHAYCIFFTDPVSGEKLRVEIPADL